MCGIVAYLGEKEAYPILIEGLKRLEYRGYDSAGVALVNGDMKVLKKRGKVSDLEKHVASHDDLDLNATSGIAHTRWATHGRPNDVNAHPHVSGNGRLALIHNGIIENYATIKKALESRGHSFESDTDTEVLVHLIEEIQDQKDLPLEEAVRLALNQVKGAYAIVVVDKNEPDKVVGAKLSSPMVFGIGENEYFLASDASPIISFTNKVIYLQDGEVICMHRNGSYQIRSLDNKLSDPEIMELDLKIDELEKGGFAHFMLKEIHQQPITVAESMRGRINGAEGWAILGGMRQNLGRISQAKRIILTACGTSYYAALIGEYLLEDLARIPSEVEYASEFRYRNPIINEDDFIVALSQSGETADTLAAIKMAKSRGALLYGIVNTCLLYTSPSPRDS